MTTPHEWLMNEFEGTLDEFRRGYHEETFIDTMAIESLFVRPMFQIMELPTGLLARWPKPLNDIEDWDDDSE